MISVEVDRRFREWAHGEPGFFEASSGAETVRLAWAASGIQCSVSDFESVLARYGFVPKQITAGVYRLLTPSPAVNSFPPNMRR